MASLQPVVRGRGARSNASGRFETMARESFDDGWTPDEVSGQVPTTVTPLKQKTIISRNQSPDIGFDASINPYVGCSHGCVYSPVTRKWAGDRS